MSNTTTKKSKEPHNAPKGKSKEAEHIKLQNNAEVLEVKADIDSTEEAELICVQDISDPVQNAANRIPVNPQLQHFRTNDGPFGWFPHGVTGDELNQFVNSIQKHLIESHENNIELRNMCEQLLWDLGQFDEKYMQQTINSVKASEQACLETRKTKDSLEAMHAQLKQVLDDVLHKLESVDRENDELHKKIRSAYIIAGGSGLIAFVALLFHFISAG